MDKKNIRVFFAKKGRAVYISHLDLMRTMQRALKRSGLPVWYTEGFNPRIYLNFPLALSLGVEGLCEPMDLAVVEEISFDEIIEKLSGAMPEGLEIVKAAYPVHPNKVIGFAEYSAEYSGDGNKLKKALDGFMTQDKIEVLKHSKRKGMITVDIRPHIAVNSAEISENGMIVGFRMPAGLELNLNAGIFTDAFEEYCVKTGCTASLECTKRTNIFCLDGAVFE